MESRAPLAQDPLGVVRSFLEDLREGRKTRAQVGEIRESLEDLYGRMERVRALSTQFPKLKAVDLGEEVWDLMELIGKRRARRRLMARAALL